VDYRGASVIARLRLGAQHAGSASLDTPADVVRHLGAVQAQDYRGGLWAVGLRAAGATEVSVEQALAAKSIVRSWPMRGTLHFVAPEDLRWMLEHLAPRSIAGAAGRFRQLGLEADQLRRSRRILERALASGVGMTRPEVFALLGRGGVSTVGQRGIHILWMLAHEGVICFGPPRGRQQTFVLLDEWLPAREPLTRPEALAEIALRYFRGHGPATVGDLAWWAGLTLADAGEGLKSSASRLARWQFDGEDYWGPEAGFPAPTKPPPALILPPFDEFLVAFRNRGAALDPADTGRLASLLSPTIVVKGRVVGTWKRRLTRGRLVIVPRFFSPSTEGRLRTLRPALERYGAFLGEHVELEQGGPTARGRRIIR
jgi:hypothetical protein